MDSESQSVVHGSVETDNDGIRNDRVSESNGLNGVAEVQNNGSYNVQYDDHGEGDEKGKGNIVLGSGNLLPGVLSSETSPSPTVTKKGYGLRKWKRIDRNAAKSSGGTGKVETSLDMKEERSNSVLNPSKRAQVYVEKENNENSVSSTNAMVKSLEGFALSGEPILGPEALFGTGTDSDNSEDRSSKSSTAASGKPLKYDRPDVVGFPHDKSRLRTLSGKNLTHSVNRGQHGKVQGESTKKPREGSIKLLKESVSSFESDSCSSSFVFMPEASAMNNGMRGEKHFDYGGQSDTEAEKNYNDQGDKEKNGEEGYENMSPDNGVAHSSWEVKVERKEVNGFSAVKDPLVEAIDSLQYAKEALEKEMLKFREISKHVEDSISEIHIEAAADEQNLMETSSERFEKEMEQLLMKKIEAEVEYLTISSMVRKLRADAADQITLQKAQALASSQRNKAEEFEEVTSSKLQTKICTYTSYFFLQMVLLVFIFGLFKLKSQSYVEVVPT